MTQSTSTPSIILVAGWGVPAAMVAPLLDGWPGDVQLVDLDSKWVRGARGVDDVASRLLQHFRKPAIWLGWSQGGQVAVSAARQAPSQVRAVITLCSFPRFVASDDWPYGMAPDTFRQFQDGLGSAPERYWKRFLALQVLGGPDEQAAKRALAPWLTAGPPLPPQELEMTLAWLGSTDQRELWQAPVVPTLHLWGDQDYLVDTRVADVVSGWPGDVRQVPGMGHWPRGNAVAYCQDEIQQFVSSLGGSK